MNLIKYIAKRIFNGLIVMIGVVLVIFILFNILPVNSARMTLGQRADTASIEAIEREFRLNLPWYERLGLYFNDLSPISLHNLADEKSSTFIQEKDVKYTKLLTLGSSSLVFKAPYLGKSFQTRRNVSEVISERIFPTFLLAVFAMSLASVTGIISGVIAAIRHNTWVDDMIVTLSTLGTSQPGYVTGYILAAIFGYYLSAYTGLGVVSQLYEYDLDGERIVWKNLILPVVALGIRPISLIAQLTRSAMLDVLNQDYIRTARAKGVSKNKVLFKHALRNAMNPILTSLTGWFAAVLTGAYFVEKVFSYNGLGLLTIGSILNFDFPVVMGCVLLVATIFVLMNIVTDILYSILDPRVVIKG